MRNTCSVTCSASALRLLFSHALHQLSERAPEVFALREVELLDEEDEMLERRVKVLVQAQGSDDGVVVAVDVRIHSVQALEELPDERRESLWERCACFRELAPVLCSSRKE